MWKRLLPLAALALLLAPGASHAAGAATAFGPRVGLSIDPEQLVVGGQIMVGDLAPDVTFSPSIEFGFGDNATVIAMNLDGAYHFRIEGSPWRPYAGFGLGVNFIEVDRPGNDFSDTEVSANLIIGAGVPTRSNNRFFTEMRFGVGNYLVPDLKIIAGWLFPM